MGKNGTGGIVIYKHNIKPDNYAPTKNSITSQGNGTVENYNNKGTVTATYTDTFNPSNNMVYMRLIDKDKQTIITDWQAATRSGTTYTKSFDVMAEIRDPANVYVEVKDACGNITQLENGAVSMQYIDALAPRLTEGQISSEEWSKNKEIIYTTLDEGVGNVEIAFNNEDDFQVANKNGDNYSRTYNFIGDVYGSVTLPLYMKDGLNNIRTERVTISNIDNTAPTITNVKQTIDANKKKAIIEVSANDINTTLNQSGSGVAGYAITETSETPSSFQEENTLEVSKNGTYYLWVKDAVGNVSKAKTVLVKDLEIEIAGKISWDDLNNQYDAREKAIIHLYRKVGEGEKELVSTQDIKLGETNYNFTTREMNENGEGYTFHIEEETIDGYETLYSQNDIKNTETQNIEINITNRFILPEYTGEFKIEPIHSYNNQLLKNTDVKITATIEANKENRDSVGVHEGEAVISLDSKIKLDKNNIMLIYEDAQGKKTTIEDYTLKGNTITTYVGSTEEGISMAGGKLTVEANGVLREIGEYQNEMIFSGKLRDYRETNTKIDLGVILEKKKEETNFVVDYQIPEANIEVKKIDSITKENLPDATFILYEWNGETFVEKEKLNYDEEEKTYKSGTYRWNATTEGKYKIVEKGIPSYHKDLNVFMEYNLNEYHDTNYTVTIDYNKYVMQYGKGKPDGFTEIEGTVQNEPWKLKANIEKIDSITQNVIQAETEFAIYEWNKETNEYEEYSSYLTIDKKIKMVRQEDKSYLTEEWLYYTPKNEGKYRIVETKAPEGYYGNYREDGKKRTYDVNIIESIESKNYHGQVVENESTLNISNQEGQSGKEEMTGKRVETTLQVTVVDKETKSIAQGDATLEGAKYGIYAAEQINHADGITSRYEEEPGVLYKKEELVETVTTDKEGRIIIENLECGKYYIQMLEAPEGYQFDETKYDIDFTYQGEEKEKLEEEKTIELKVKKQAFQLCKQKENQEKLSNAGFSMYLISNLSIVKEGKVTKVSKDIYYLNDEIAKESEQLKGKENEDGTYYLADLIDYYYKVNLTEGNAETLPGDGEVYHPYQIQETYVKDYSTSQEGNDIEEIRTDKTGYMKSPELAYGEYIILETSVPREQQVVKGFIIKVEEDNRETQELRTVIDKDFKTRVKVYLKDANTQKAILNKNISYVIKNEETGEYITILQSNGEMKGTPENPFEEKGQSYFITPMELPIGKYIIEEVTAPEGYVLNGKEGYAEGDKLVNNPREKIRFEIASNQIYYMDHYLGNYIIAVEQEKEEVVGNISIKSKAEQSIKEQKADGSYRISYEIKDMSNVEYEIYAVEDIYSQDNQKEIRYQKDQRVAKVVADEKGEAILTNLPQGKYRVKQITKNGNFLKQEEQEIEISYEGQEIPVVFKTIESIQRVSKFFIKLEDKETKEIPDAIIEIKDKEGNIVASTEEKEDIIPIIKTEEGYYIEGLPEGEYKVEEIRSEGYQKVEATTITIKNTQEKQGMTVETRKLIFDVEIEKKLNNIVINGESTNVENSNDIIKVEIKERNIPSIDLQLQYSIIVRNKGEIEARIEELVDQIPQGLSYEEKKEANWKVKNQVATYGETIVLQPGESKEILITLKWKNSISNFGEKRNTVKLVKVTNPYGYENRNKGEEIDAASIVISVGTGLEEKVTMVRMIASTFAIIGFIATIKIINLKRKGKINR